jgi:uncharacterized protein (DUF2344 family)
MITTWLAALSTLTLIGFLALSRAVKRAPLGYEDASGFHFGREPQMALLEELPDDSSTSQEQASEDNVVVLVDDDAA